MPDLPPAKPPRAVLQPKPRRPAAGCLLGRLGRLALGLLGLAASAGLACRHTRQEAAATTAIHAETAWVTTYEPSLASPGYTLTLLDERIPVLLDLHGRPVHAWPEARLKSRVRLLPDGSVLGIGLGRQVVEYDWEGRQTWEFRTPGAIPHHDVVRLANGNTLVLVLKEGEGSDTLCEVNRARQVVWTWRAAEHLAKLAPQGAAHPEDATHINSLQEIPPNPWYARGDSRFRPGNLLVSSRNLNTLFIVDRASGEILWTFTEDLDRQHEALMNGQGLPGPGRILVFNNRQRSYAGDHRSELLEINPADGSIAWRFQAPGFFSPTGGTAQALPNGNLLITSTRGGRVFEITRAGRIAWEWVPPYEPMRAVRVPANACPQLARLALPTLAAIRHPGYRYVDRDAYRFARQGSRMNAVIGGEPRTVLKDANDCRELVLPAAARVQVGYGVDRDRLRAAQRGERPPEFVLSLLPEGRNAPVLLLRDRVGIDGEAWRERTIPLDAYGLQSVELCVEIDGGATQPGGRKARFAYWEQPLIDFPQRETRRAEAEDDDATRAPAPSGLTPEELEVQRKHLKALGYIN